MKKRGLGLKKLENRILLDAAAVAAISDAVLHFDATDVDADGSTLDQPSVPADNPEQGLTPLTTGSGTDSFNSTDAQFPPQTSAFFAIDLTVGGSPSGSLFETGGGGRGVYVGFDTSNNFVVRAGDGATPPGGVDANLTGAAILRVSEAPLLNKTGTIYVEVNVSTSSVSAWFLEGGVGGGGTPVFLGEAFAPSGSFEQDGGNPEMHGGGSGGLGGRNSGVGGENNANYNDTITGFRFYTDTLSPIDGPVLTGNVWQDGAGSGAEKNDASPFTTGHLTLDENAFATGLAGVDFSRTNDAIALIDSDNLNLDLAGYDQKSFAMTFKTGSSFTSDQIIYEQGGTTNGYVFGIFDADGAGAGTAYHLYAYAYSNLDDGSTANDSTALIDLGAVTTDTAYSLVAIHDALSGNSFSASVNGGAFTTVNTLASMPQHTGDGTLGGDAEGLVSPFDLTDGGATIIDQDFKGFIGELWSWNTALTVGETASVNSYLDAKWLSGNSPPVVDTNTGVNVNQGNTVTITNTDLSVSDPNSPGWYDRNWDYRQSITIPAANIDADLTDFTVLLTGANFNSEFWDNVQNDGGDIVLTSADGTTKLSRELVTIDTVAQTMELHVKIPSISSTTDTSFFIYYGNTAANETNDTSTWNSNFEGVWHLGEADGNSQDSTVNANNGTAINGANGAGGQIGDGVDFTDTTQDGVNLGDIDNVELSPVTFSFWAQVDNNAQDHDFITKGAHGQFVPILIWYDDAVNGSIPSVGAGNTNTLSVLFYDGAVQEWIAAPTDALNNTDWNHIVVTIDPGVANTANIYINGTLVATDNTISNNGIRATADSLRIGTDSNGGAQDADGRMDEFKIASTILSAEWISAEYANQLNPSTFYSVGSQQSVTGRFATYELSADVSNGTLFLDTNSNNIADGGEILSVNDTFTQDDIDAGLLKYTHDNTLTGTDNFEFNLTDDILTVAGGTFDITINIPPVAPEFDNWSLVSTEDFEGGAAGWNNNTTTNNGDFTEYLGRFSQDGNAQTVFKTYNLSGTQDSSVITFDFYEIDDWDAGTDTFQIYIDDVNIFDQAFRRETYDQPLDGSVGNVSWTVQELATNTGNLGHNGGRHDQAYRFTLTINESNSTVKLGFGSGLNGNTNDEAWGIDNVSVYEVGGSGTPGPFAVSEIAGVGQSLGFASATDQNFADTLTYTIQSGNGDGIFGIDAATGEITIVDTTNLDFETTSSYSLTIRVTDDSGGMLFDQDIITINILDAFENNAPTVNAAGPFSVAEDTVLNTVIGTVTANDVDGDTISFAITNGNADGIFAINNAGQIRINDVTNLSFERDTSYTLTIRATDNGFGNLTGTRNVTINITDVNEAPTWDAVQGILDANPFVSYNATTGNFYQYINTNTNFDAATLDAASRTLVGGNGVGGHLVTITSAAENTFVDGLISNSIWLGARDNVVEGEWRWVTGGAESGQMFWLGNASGSVQNGLYENWRGGEPNGTSEDHAEMRTDGTWNDINGGNRRYVVEWEGADVLLANSTGPFNVNEDAAVLDSVGTVRAYDQDAGQTLSYSIQGGNADGIFAIDNNSGAITIADRTNLNFESTNTYNLTVRATDNGAGTLFADQVITININDVNDAPTDITLDSSSVDENSTLGTLVATLSGVDEDLPGDLLTYSLIADPDSKFSLVGDQLRLNGAVNHENIGSHSVTLRVSDGSVTFDKVFAIGVNDVNEAPTDITLVGMDVDENSAINSIIGALSADDVDLPGDTFTYTIESGGAGLFGISGSDLVVNGPIDFETAVSHDLTIRVSDGTLSFDKVFSITVNDVSDDPIIVVPPPLDGDTGTPPAPNSEGSGTVLRAITNTLLGRDNLTISSALSGDARVFDRAIYGDRGLSQIIQTNVIDRINEVSEAMISDPVSVEGAVEALNVGPVVVSQSQEEQLNVESEGTDNISQPDIHLTNLRQSAEFYSDFMEVDGVEENKESEEQSAEEDKSQNVRIYHQFEDVLTYHEQKKAKLRAALLS